MVGGLWESKVRCIDTIPNTSPCHGVMGADRNCTGPENMERAREKAACWHNPNNPTRRVARCNRTEQNRTILSRAYTTEQYHTIQHNIT